MDEIASPCTPQSAELTSNTAKGNKGVPKQNTAEYGGVKAGLGASEGGALKQSRLYDSHYILSKQEQELDRRIER